MLPAAFRRSAIKAREPRAPLWVVVLLAVQLLTPFGLHELLTIGN
jgi:hypothetical protein